MGVVLGTVGYMSPEQARGREVDFRSDQFAVGAILYEMATGRQAFRRETPAQTIAAIIEDAPEPLAILNPALPAPARWIIERCLAKEPSERYASTLDLGRELRNVRERLPEVASSASSGRAAPSLLDWRRSARARSPPRSPCSPSPGARGSCGETPSRRRRPPAGPRSSPCCPSRT